MLLREALLPLQKDHNIICIENMSDGIGVPLTIIGIILPFEPALKCIK